MSNNKYIKKFNESSRLQTYETDIVDKVLLIIEDEQEYLTKPENLPQLAKLGYIFSTLHRVGRVAYGYNGVVLKDRSCEGNPKDKIESLDYINNEIGDLVYDAWSMHYSDSEQVTPNYENFCKFVFGGRTLTDIEIRLKKKNKTFDDWVEIMTDPNYRYYSLFPSRQRVADYLLCVIGTGYSLSDEGYVTQDAGGGDKDIAIYGDWENAKFSKRIEDAIKYIVINKLVAEGLDALNKIEEDTLNKKRTDPSAIRTKELAKREIEKEKLPVKGFSWYPISDYSIIYKIMYQKNVHKSYIDAGIEICKDIVENELKPDPMYKNPEYIERMKKTHKANLEFAKKFLIKFKK